MAHHQMLTFPILAAAEIVECMDELAIPVTLADLAKPNGHHMRRVFESFLDLLMGVTRDTFEQPTFDVGTMLEMPELHLQSIADMSCFYALREMMSVVGVTDFNLKDLIKPEPDRVALILSGLVNFGKFREMQLVNFDQLTEKTDQLAERKAVLEQETSELKEKLELAQKQRAIEEPFAKDLLLEREALAKAVTALHDEQEALQGEFQTLKQVSNELVDKIATLRAEMTSLQADNAKLSSQVIESPDKLKQTMQELNGGLRKEQDGAQAFEKKLRDISVKVDALAQVEQEIERCTKLLAEAEQELQRLEDVQRHLGAGQENVSRSEANLRDVGLKEQSLKRQMQSASEKQVRQQRQQTMRREAFDARIRQLRQEHGLLASERMAQVRQVQDLDELIARTETRMSDLRQQQQQEMAGLRAEYAQLKQTVDGYHAQLAHAMSSS